MTNSRYHRDFRAAPIWPCQSLQSIQKIFLPPRQAQETPEPKKLQFLMNRSSGGGLAGEAPSCPDKIQNLSSSYYQHISTLWEIILDLSSIPMAAATLIPPAFYLPSHFGHMTTSLSVPFSSPFPSTFMSFLFPRCCPVSSWTLVFSQVAQVAPNYSQ